MVRQSLPIRDNIFFVQFLEWDLTNIYKRAIARSGVSLMTLRPFLRKLIMVLPFLFPLFFSGCGAPPGNPEEGKKWYMMHNCYSCHGLHGDDGRAVKIAGIKMGFGSFVQKLRSTDSAIMRSFPESKISQQDAADIYAYLKNMPPKDAR